MFGKLFAGGDKAQSPPAGTQRASFLPLYDREFAPHLGERAASFRIMFERLEAMADSLKRPLLIVETGSMRNEGDWGAGQSTLLWKTFAGFRDCEIHTVDLNPDTTQLVKRICGDAVQAHTGDSVEFLYAMANAVPPRHIDLLYLDSFDFEPTEPFPSAMHHVKELIAARPCLGKGSIVAIDDNFAHPEDPELFSGKGYLAMQWFKHLRIPFLHRGYQFVWQI